MKIEEVMAQVAHSQLMQSMPSLKDYIIGFEMVDSNEDENQGLGVVLAKLGTLYFNPVLL